MHIGEVLQKFSGAHWRSSSKLIQCISGDFLESMPMHEFITDQVNINSFDSTGGVLTNSIN
jgi:hypothetical protein